MTGIVNVQERQDSDQDMDHFMKSDHPQKIDSRARTRTKVFHEIVCGAEDERNYK